jgi:hypothetical protein
LQENLPTGALVTLAITHTCWQQLTEGEQKLVGCVVARDLTS